MIGGGQIGYNFQTGPIVYGIVADASAMRLRQTSSISFGDNPRAGSPFGSVATDTAYLRASQTALYTVRGKLGYAMDPFLFYVTGGLAVSDVDLRVTEVLSNGLLSRCVDPTVCRNVSTSKMATGYTVGAGVQYALDANWSVGAEYLYADLGTKRASLPQAQLSVRFPASTTSYRMDNHIARVTVNYKFNWF